jgi:hypothetical protein
MTNVEYVPNSVAHYIGQLLTERSGGPLSAGGKGWSEAECEVTNLITV